MKGNHAKSNFKFGMVRLDSALKSPNKPWKVSEIYEAVKTSRLAESAESLEVLEITSSLQLSG